MPRSVLGFPKKRERTPRKRGRPAGGPVGGLLDTPERPARSPLVGGRRDAGTTEPYDGQPPRTARRGGRSTDQRGSRLTNPHPALTTGIRGSRERKIKAAHQPPPHTSPGSVSMPPATPTIPPQAGTTDAPISPTMEYGERRQTPPRTSSLASPSGKVPTVPAHTRSPEAHVEAPTAGPPISAGIPPKPGTHGSSRSNTPMRPVATPHPTPLVHGPALIAIVHTSPTTPRQTDPKRNIAHPPVAHTNPATPGMFSLA